MTAHRQSASPLNPIGRLFGAGTLAGLSEGQLLERFAADRDELAFAGLVERLGPMVVGVCRRRLSDPRDVEDAFQATFLVLVRKARSIREPRLVGNWLFGVAARVASRSRAEAVRRKGREGPWVDVADKGQPDDLRAALDEEIARLPEKYRRPLVLCYLEGLTHDEAADRLRCPVGTVRSRMAWARDRLRSRLGRLGAAVPSGLAVATEATAMSPSVPTDWAARAIQSLAPPSASGAGVVSAQVALLTREVIRAMTIRKFQAVLLVTMAMVLGIGLRALPGQLGGPAPVIPAAAAPEPKPVRPDEPGKEQFKARQPGIPGAGALYGRAPTLKNQRVMNMGRLVAAFSPERDRIWVYSVDAGTWDLYRATPGTTIAPVASGSIVTAQIKGDRITEVAVISQKSGKWRTQQLRTPASGELHAIVGPVFAAYTVGGQVYAYSAEADRWDVLDLGSDKAATPLVGPSTIIVEDGDRLAVFGATSGKWESIDLSKK